MSKEKKLKRYAESRLSSYAEGEDSLARLKQEQGATPSPKKIKAPRPMLRKMGLGLSTLALAVVAVCLVLFLPSGKGESSLSSDLKSYTPVQNGGVAEYSDSTLSGRGLSAEDINEEMQTLRLVLPEGATIDNVATKDGYYYSVTTEGGFRAVISFGALPSGASFETDRESTIAGCRLDYAYSEEGVLRGRIKTQKETVCVLHCEGESEQACLDFLREIIKEK